MNRQPNVRNQHFLNIPRYPCYFECNVPCKRRSFKPYPGCFVVPNNCKKDSDCPDIGKTCSGYLIPSIGCRNGKCKYGPVLTRLGATMDDKPYSKRFEKCKCKKSTDISLLDYLRRNHSVEWMKELMKKILYRPGPLAFF